MWMYSGSYRFGFNGQEKDDEVKGEGNQQDYGMRIYDPRLGRFLSPDPLIVYGKKYPELSTYQFASNTPIVAIDIDGLEMYNVMIYHGDDGNITRIAIVHYTKDNTLTDLGLTCLNTKTRAFEENTKYGFNHIYPDNSKNYMYGSQNFKYEPEAQEVFNTTPVKNQSTDGQSYDATKAGFNKVKYSDGIMSNQIKDFPPPPPTPPTKTANKRNKNATTVAAQAPSSINVIFGSYSSNILDINMAQVSQLAQFMSENPKTVVTITTHLGDPNRPAGSIPYFCKELLHTRAVAIKDRLAKEGIPKSKIKIIIKGNNPIVML